MPTNLDLELQERLGHGSMTEVWKAFDPQLQRNVAVKIFHADLLNDPAFMTRFWDLALSPEAQKIHFPPPQKPEARSAKKGVLR